MEKFKQLSNHFEEFIQFTKKNTKPIIGKWQIYKRRYTTN